MDKRKGTLKNLTKLTGIIFLFLLFSGTVKASEQTINIETIKQGLDTVWVLIGAFLVFFMQAGFGMVEAGFIRAKNTCNILTKNFLDFCMASLGFFLIGYGLMFGKTNGFCGTTGFALSGVTGGDRSGTIRQSSSRTAR